MAKYQCPECSATLRRAEAVAPGKKIRCPKCEAVFKAVLMPEDEPAKEEEAGYAVAGVAAKVAPPKPIEEEEENGDPYAVIKSVVSTASLAKPASAGDAEYQFPAAAVGQSTYGLPGWTRQADVLRPLAPILTVRDDTFTIRAYGDARDASGKVISKATCEAVVRRTRDYMDPGDAADILTQPTRPANLTFGRRYQIISFRWLNPSEI